MTVGGPALLAAGMGRLAFTRPDGSVWVDVLPASVVAALGAGALLAATTLRGTPRAATRTTRATSTAA